MESSIISTTLHIGGSAGNITAEITKKLAQGNVRSVANALAINLRNSYTDTEDRTY